MALLISTNEYAIRFKKNSSGQISVYIEDVIGRNVIYLEEKEKEDFLAKYELYTKSLLSFEALEKKLDDLCKPLFVEEMTA